MAKKRTFELEIANSLHLTDGDWTELNKLKRAFEDGGKTALAKAVEQLGDDPIRYVNVMAAVFPEMIREKLKDLLADAGITADDAHELLQKLEYSGDPSKNLPLTSRLRASGPSSIDRPIAVAVGGYALHYSWPGAPGPWGRPELF